MNRIAAFRGEAIRVFHDIPRPVRRRMTCLERLDAEHRRKGMDQFRRLRQIPPATGKFLALLAAGAPEGRMIEIGTSGGYSALWLSLALRPMGRRLTTFEIADEKIALARETFREAEIDDMVELVKGDAREHLGGYKRIAFCFLDAEKEAYDSCHRAVAPNMVPGGVLAADNVISHREVLKPWIRKVLADRRMDSVIVPIGSGVLVARRN
jgi:predicted O-methyltransferase YrrM